MFYFLTKPLYKVAARNSKLEEVMTELSMNQNAESWSNGTGSHSLSFKAKTTSPST
jgi:hypothetical protein